MRIATILTAWGRPALTDLVFKHFSDLYVLGNDLYIFVAISPEDPYFNDIEKSARRHGLQICLVSNEFLCDKMNAVMNMALSCDPDAVLAIGSDDFITPAMITDMISGLAYGDFSQPAAIHFYDVATDRAIVRQMSQTGIRMFSRSALDKMSWKMWSDLNKNKKAMDAAQDMLISGVLEKVTIPDVDGSVVLDVKCSGGSRISFQSYDRNLPGPDVPVRLLFDKNFPGLYPKIRLV